MSTPVGHATAVDGSTVDGWTVVVPVKDLERAKSRLSRVLSPADRRSLVLAMATDVLVACAATPGVARVLVASSDPRVGELARRLRIEVLPDPSPANLRPGEDPLNTALVHAIGDVAGPVAVVAADLPELSPSRLGRVLAAAARHPHSIVPDHRGAGTTMAFWTGPVAARVPRFGVGSAARHRAEGGAVAVGGADPSGATGRDVDTPGDLAALDGRAVGPATAAALGTPSPAHPARDPGASATMVP